MFARYLNASESTVEKWETGAKKPSGTALKLLFLVQKHGLQHLAQAQDFALMRLTCVRMFTIEGHASSFAPRLWGRK